VLPAVDPNEAALPSRCLVLGREDKIAFYAPRFAAAFPEDYQRWRDAHAK
jgi:hypothetical protein